jgi:RNA polymerase sigma factor (sigma-70 family)
MSARSEADVRSLEILFTVGTQSGLSDAELLERFLASTDEAAEFAFEGLAVRHGPMVFDVCRKILGDAHDADDAFQATFLILATRARSILKQRSVGSWLHGVALRVARRARSDAARRTAQERRIAEMRSRIVEAEPPREQDDFQVLHEEVERLPRKYREPVVLCYLEGMSLETAAGQLGCPIGTVGVRLMRARERLKARLDRRGVSGADGFVIAGLSSRGVSAVLPNALIRSTASAAVRLTSGGVVPLAAASLTREVLRSMVMIKLAKVSVAVLAVVIAAGSFGRGFLFRSRMLAEKEPTSEGTQHVAPFRIGQQVVTKYTQPLRDGDRVVEADVLFRIYVVDRIEGDRVRIASEDVSAWTHLSNIVLLVEAIDFYRREIGDNPYNAPAYRQRALVRSLWEGELEEAIDDYTVAIRLEPGHGPTYENRGLTWAEMGEYDKAILDYDEVIRLEPKYGPAYLYRGLAWATKDDNDKVIADLTQAIRLGSGNVKANKQRGLAWAAKGDYDKAIADYDKAIPLDPNDASTYGRAWAEKKQYDRAIADLSKAIELESKLVDAYLERGRAWDNKKDWDKAISDFSEAIRLDPQNPYVYSSRGEVWREKGQFDRAMADFDESIRRGPQEALCYVVRGRMWAYQKELDRAIADLEEAIRLDPKETFAYHSRGGVWLDKGDSDKAIADFNESIRLDPHLAGSDYLYRGWAWYQKTRYGKAIADFNEAARLAPEWPEGYHARAWLWATCPEERYRDGEKAVESATKACDLTKWKEAAYLETLAAAHAEAGDFESAVKWQTKANELYTDAEEKTGSETRLKLYRGKEPYRDAGRLPSQEFLGSL